MDDARRRVLDAALGMFSDRGFDDVTMTDIAAAAGVARATVFNYFGSKHSLVETITETVLDAYRAMLDEALADSETPTPDLLRRLCRDMALGIEDTRRFYRSVFREIARIHLGLDEGSVAQRANEQTLARVRALIERGRQRGDITSDRSADGLASAFHALTNGTITSWLYRDTTEPLEPYLAEAAEVFLGAVAGPCTSST